jgi:flagellar hook assembly protein FlgD
MLITSIEDDMGKNKSSSPESMMLLSNYPNPFNASTVIKFTVPYDLSFQRAKLTIYNIQGEVIRELLDENLASGTYLTRWDGMNASGSVVPSGVYFYNLRLGAKSLSGKMSLIK